MNRKNIFIALFLLLRIPFFFSMEQFDTTIFFASENESTENKQDECKVLKKTTESDGYDKEIRNPKKNITQSKTASKKNLIKKYECSLCSCAANQYKNMHAHALKKHYNNPEVRIKKNSLIKCGGIVPTQTIITTYLEVKDLGKIYKCPSCEKPFRVVYDLTLHLNSGECKTKLKIELEKAKNPTNSTLINLLQLNCDTKAKLTKAEFCTICNQVLQTRTPEVHKNSLKHQIKEAREKSKQHENESIPTSQTEQLEYSETEKLETISSCAEQECTIKPKDVHQI